MSIDYISALNGLAICFCLSCLVLLIRITSWAAAQMLIVDLWIRENQNRHVQEIANAVAGLYDKVVGFVKQVEDIGKHIHKAEDSHRAAIGNLTSGRVDLISSP